MAVSATAIIRQYARKTGQNLPKVKTPAKENVGETKWLDAWTRLYPSYTLDRQVPFKIPGHRNPFKMDFLHRQTSVVVEISGGVHSIQSVRKRDYMRTRYLMDQGFLVYTFCTSDLTKVMIGNHCKQVFEAINKRLGGTTNG